MTLWGVGVAINSLAVALNLASYYANPERREITLVWLTFNAIAFALFVIAA